MVGIKKTFFTHESFFFTKQMSIPEELYLIEEEGKYMSSLIMKLNEESKSSKREILALGQKVDELTKGLKKLVSVKCSLTYVAIK